MTRPVALLLTALTGFSGLVYEVAWEKYLATLLGSHAEATAAVLGLFLGGLSLGYALFGRLARRAVTRAAAAGTAPRLLVAYGIVEAGIGLWVLAFPKLFDAVRALSLAVARGSAGVDFLVDVALSALLVLPPAVLMGGTIPMLTQALSRSPSDATRLHALVYGSNTAGAFAGALAAGFVLIPELGLARVMTVMGCLNLAAGGAFAGLGGRRGEAPPPVAEASGAGAGAPALAYLAVAFLSGFAMMTIQATLVRVGGLALGGSHFTFSMVVAAFVLCIAVGSLAVSTLPRVPGFLLVANQWGLVVLLILLHGVLEHAPYGAHVLRSLFRNEPGDFHAYYAAAFLAALGVVGPAIVLSGATLPLLFHHLRRRLGDLGALAGRIYSWNTLGSLLGALVGGYALFAWLDLDAIFRVAVASLALGACLLSVHALRLRTPLAGALLALALGVIAWRPAWNPAHLASGFFLLRSAQPATYAGPAAFYAERLSDERWVFYDDDPVASVSVLEASTDTGNRVRSIATNGKVDGNTSSDYPTMGLAATLPALLARKTERAFVIGFGTGVSAGELASLRATREVVVAEISPAVLEAAPLFDFANLGVSKHPRVRLVRGDAYRVLLHSEARFDVISSEPSHPWKTGVEMLYSREFLEAARGRLAPGGVYCQWFHLYGTDAATLELVLRTYASVFDEMAIWYGLGPDLLLLGFDSRAGPFDLEQARERFRRADFRASYRRSGNSSFSALLAHELVPQGVMRQLDLRGPVHSLEHPRLAHLAARAFFAGEPADLPFTGSGSAGRLGRENSAWRRHLRSFADGAPASHYEQFARETCRYRKTECVPALAQWRRAYPDSADVERVHARLRRSVLRHRGRPPGRRAVRDFYEAFYAPEGGSSSPERATRAPRLFREYYSHAASPAPDALAEIRERCAPGC
jgi:predicted membrane-bound spermidine synthase